MYSFEARGTPTFVSDNIKRVLGYEPRDYLDNPNFWRERIHPDDVARVETEISRTFESGVNALEYRFRCSDGTYCWVKDEQTLVRDADGGRNQRRHRDEHDVLAQTHHELRAVRRVEREERTHPKRVSSSWRT